MCRAWFDSASRASNQRRQDHQCKKRKMPGQPGVRNGHVLPCLPPTCSSLLFLTLERPGTLPTGNQSRRQMISVIFFFLFSFYSRLFPKTHPFFRKVQLTMLGRERETIIASSMTTHRTPTRCVAESGSCSENSCSLVFFLPKQYAVMTSN